MYHCNIDDFTCKSLAPGVEIKALTGEKMSMVVFSIAPGADIPEHSHPHEQMGTVLKGSMELSAMRKRWSGLEMPGASPRMWFTPVTALTKPPR